MKNNPTQAQRDLVETILDMVKFNYDKKENFFSYSRKDTAQLIADHVAEEVAKAKEHMCDVAYNVYNCIDFNEKHVEWLNGASAVLEALGDEIETPPKEGGE